MQSKFTAAAAAISFIALAGCAQMETGATPGSAHNGQEPVATKTSARPADIGSARAADANTAQAAIENPALVEFDARSVELSSQAQTQVAKLAAPGKRANKIVVTGYADKKTNSKAQDVALARAAKVKDELVKNGVLAKNIRLKYITDQAKHAAKIEWSGEALKVVDSAPRASKN